MFQRSFLAPGRRGMAGNGLCLASSTFSLYGPVRSSNRIMAI
ncbi:hypothetical protein HMPREF3038_01706 [Akkermansia sp. KLE1797]|nr:hypothetical protein HMPREF3038_01706 [Akkermansia sp. KLE1797]KXU53909.1 hypothetical protein HMPREF3039_01864 [Akkermansia sp. KLE1798]